MRNSFLVIIIVFVIAVGLVVGLYFYVSNNGSTNNGAGVRTYPVVTINPDYDVDDIIEDLSDNNLHGGQFNVIGYVIVKGLCLGCPLDAQCLSCQLDASLAVAERAGDSFSSESAITIRAQDLDQFLIGSPYRFMVTIDADLKEITLLGYEEVESTS